MAKAAKIDPLESAKVTDEKVKNDAAALGRVLPVNPAAPPTVEDVPLRTDGPTIEEFLANGNIASDYPPEGYAERPSSGLTLHKVGATVPDEMIDAVHADRAPAENRELWVVTQAARISVGGGQIAHFAKGYVIDPASYGGEPGVQRLITNGLKLERHAKPA